MVNVSRQELFEKIRNQERENLKYQNDPEYRLKKQQQALARYYKNKETKLNASLTVK